MIDFDATLEDMLAGISWQPQIHYMNLSDASDERVYEMPQTHLATSGRRTEPDPIVGLGRLYLKKFPQASYELLYYDLVRPVKQGTSNAVKRGNGNDYTKSVLLEHYFTKYGVVVAITDQGKGFDYRRTHSLFEKGARYGAFHGGGLKAFARSGATISYDNGGRTLLVQYRVDSARPTSPREWRASVAHRLEPLESVESLREIKKRSPPLYFLAKCEPELLGAFWTSPTFMETYIHPALPDQRQPDRADVVSSAEIVDADRQAVTIRYTLGNDTIVAKFFRRAKQGMRTHEILRAAWYSGFGAGRPYQVPRPLAYHPDRRLLLTTAIDGIALNLFLHGDIDKLVRACQRAARWLQEFHATPLEAGAERGTFQGGLGQARSADAAPNDRQGALERNGVYARLLRELRAELEQRSEAAQQVAHSIVPIHGDFRPENVLLTDRATAVSSFDRSAPGEPASDLATFSFRLWNRVFMDSGQWQRAETSTTAFLVEYGARKPEHLVGVAYYWVALILRSLDRNARRFGLTEWFDHIVGFHMAQFEFARRCQEDVARLQRASISGKDKHGHEKRLT